MISSSSPSEPSTSSSSSDSDSSSVSDSSSDSSSFSGSFPLPLASFAIFYGTSSKRPAQHQCWRWESVTRVASAAGEKSVGGAARDFLGPAARHHPGKVLQFGYYSASATKLVYKAVTPSVGTHWVWSIAASSVSKFFLASLSCAFMSSSSFTLCNFFSSFRMRYSKSSVCSFPRCALTSMQR